MRVRRFHEPSRNWPACERRTHQRFQGELDWVGIRCRSGATTSLHVWAGQSASAPARRLPPWVWCLFDRSTCERQTPATEHRDVARAPLPLDGTPISQRWPGQNARYVDAWRRGTIHLVRVRCGGCLAFSRAVLFVRSSWVRDGAGTNPCKNRPQNEAHPNTKAARVLEHRPSGSTPCL